MKRQSPGLRVRGSPATALPDWLPLALALAIVVVWGATPVLTKLAAEEIGPLTVAVLRTLLGGVAAAPLALALRLPLPPRSLVLPFAISSFCAFVGFPLLFTVGQRMTSAMHGGLILAALPILTGLYAAVVERRRPKARWWAGCAIALTGEVVLIAGRAPAGQAAGSLGGDLLVVLSTLLAAMWYVAGGAHESGESRQHRHHPLGRGGRVRSNRADLPFCGGRLVPSGGKPGRLGRYCDPGLGDFDYRLYRVVLGAGPWRHCSYRHDPIPATAIGAGPGLFPPG
jgi:EamA-like transporter family protein